MKYILSRIKHRMFGTKTMAMFSIFVIFLLCSYAGATVFSWFYEEDITVTVEGFEILWDNQTAQDLTVSKEMNISAGHTITEQHTLEFNAGDGEFVTVYFDWTGLTPGFTAQAYQGGNPIDNITIAKGVVYDVNIIYEADLMIMSDVLDVTFSIDVSV